MATSGSILGNPVRRREDPGILTGVDRVLRRPHGRRAAARRVRPLDGRARRARGHRHERRAWRCRASSRCTPPPTSTCPTVHGFIMLPPTMNRPPLARDKVRFVGDIVAMVVAETKAQAVDAAETVIVDYDQLPAVVDRRSRARRRRARRVRGAGLERRQRDGHRTGRGRARRRRRRGARAHRQPARRAGADGAGRHRRGARASPRAASRSGSRRRARTACATSSRCCSASTPRSIRGAQRRRSAAGSAPRQGMIVEHLLVAKAALMLGRPVKWTETRSENMVAMWHGRGHVHDVELGLKRDGTITGLQVCTHRRRRRVPGDRRVPAVLHADDGGRTCT